ncbi:helix-turn-helix domain-containing protein [Serratia sp. BNK-17]|uniref:helix-turn-helix domain-containing protein n=1 Tax=Serratia sp. BNK-17 TaxID=3376154 RepID=UPI003B43AD3D
MAKKPKVIPPSVPSTAPVVDNLVHDLQLTDWKASSKSGQVTVSGISGRTGQHVRVTTYEGTGFSERTVSTCDLMPLDQRRQETQRLRSTGLSQQQIADRLGVSQKTVSNDLKKK